MREGAWPFDHAGQLLKELFDTAGAEREANTKRPHPKSRAATEGSELSAFKRERLVDAYSLVDFRLLAVEDHLRALAPVIGPGGGFYAVYSVARTCAEVSVRAWWLIAPQLNAEQRVERVLTDMLDDCRQQAHLGRVAAGLARARAHELATGAEAEGITINWPKEPSDWPTAAVAYKEGDWPRTAEVAGRNGASGGRLYGGRRPGVRTFQLQLPVRSLMALGRWHGIHRHTKSECGTSFRRRG